MAHVILAARDGTPLFRVHIRKSIRDQVLCSGHVAFQGRVYIYSGSTDRGMLYTETVSPVIDITCNNFECLETE